MKIYICVLSPVQWLSVYIVHQQRGGLREVTLCLGIISMYVNYDIAVDFSFVILCVEKQSNPVCKLCF